MQRAESISRGTNINCYDARNYTDSEFVDLVAGGNALDTSKFGYSSAINNGKPYLKCFYWQDSVAS